MALVKENHFVDWCVAFAHLGRVTVGDSEEGANYSIAAGQAMLGREGRDHYNARFFESPDDLA
ncbi:hypothetical protein D3C86_1825200 [compost metagenome]